MNIKLAYSITMVSGYILLSSAVFAGNCNLADGTSVAKRNGEYYSHALDAVLPSDENLSSSSGEQLTYLNGVLVVKALAAMHYFEELVSFEETIRSPCGGGGGIRIEQKLGGLKVSIKNFFYLYGVVKVQWDGFPSTTVEEYASVNLTTGLRAKYAMDDIYVTVIYAGDYYYHGIDGKLINGGMKSCVVNEFVKGSFLRYKEICCAECVQGVDH